MEFTPDDEQSVPARFEQVVACYPDRLALQFDDRSLTYAELNRTANRLARVILAECGPDQEPVGLLIEPGVWLIAAILATLKAGKIYMVLDPADPPARLAAVLNDSQARLVLASDRNQQLASKLATPALRVVQVEDQARDYASAVDAANLDLPISPDALFSLMYTSGSTGQPKGVVHTHRTTLHVTRRATNRLGLTADDRFVLLASGAFGASIANLWGSLLIGASLLPYDIKRRGFLPLADWLDREQITVYQSVPTIFRQVFAALEPGRRLDTLRVIRLGSDTVFRSDIDLFRAHCRSECFLQTSLATSETHVLANYVVRSAGEIAFEGAVVPSGYPDPGCELTLVDDAGHPVAAGDVGEIVVTSRYLSPGYWRRPDLTAAAFAPAADGARSYRTHDLGRLLADGALLHLGRKDSSIKVRGHLVPPAEVENALRSLSGVREATVVPEDAGMGEHRLVAYVVPSAGETAGLATWRAELASRLRDFMLPSTYVVLDALPLLPNGKIDRRALPLPGTQRPGLAIEYVAPRTPLEEQLGAIWADILGLDRVGVYDDFIELGGNSLLAAQVIARVSNACHVDLPVSVVFDVYTIAALAELIGQRLVDDADVREMTRLLGELETMSEADASAELSAERV